MSSKKAIENTKPQKLVLKVPVENYYGTGKRKSTITKVWVFKGTGKVSINKIDAKDFRRFIFIKYYIWTFKKLNIENKYDCFIRTVGGGKSGQADAIKLGVSRALLLLNPEFRSSLKVDGFLTRDDRVKERKKYGRKGARKGYQFRKR